MEILVGIVLPVVVFALLWMAERWLPVRLQRFFTPLVLAAICALLTGVTVVVVMYEGAKWPRSTQIAWTGVRTMPGTESFVIGGDRQTGIVGWPNGAFAPRIEVGKGSGTQASLHISRGGAFLVDPATGGVINGRVLKPKAPLTIGDYRFELEPGLWIFKARHIIVKSAAGTVVADIALRQRSSGNRFFGLDYLNTRSDPEIPKFAPYENWSRAVLVALTGDGEVRILDPGYARPVTCTLPCTFDLRWRRLTQRVVLDRMPNGAHTLRFERPWRRTSPLPPKPQEGPWQLIVTRHPEPGDYAFVLPFGGGAPSRAVMVLDDSSGVPLLRSGGANVASTAPRAGVVSSATGVKIGDLIFDFATAVDVLKPPALTFSLVAAYLAVLLGLLLTQRIFTRDQQWLVYGLVLVVWTLLAFRTGLAVRYAAAPEFLDRLAIKGVRLSMLAASLVPGTLLLAAYIRAVASRGQAARARQRGIDRWPMFFLGYLIILGFFQLAAPSRIWPELPLILDPGLGFGGLLRMGILLGVAAYFALCIVAVSKHNKPNLPVRFYESIVQTYGARFWRLIVSGSGMRGLGPIVLLAVVLSILLPFFIAQAGTKIAQEVVAPLFFTLVPAALWLSGAIHFSRSKSGRLWTVRAILAALVTVAIPVVMTPIIISDPGSMLATSSIFLPLGLLLLASSRARRAGAIVCAIFGAGLVLVILAYFNVETVLPVGGGSPAGNMPSRLFVYKRGAQVPSFILRQSENLQDAYEHTWENRAIAHEGGWKGLGFGNSLNRRSRVGQETLQADSVFSFFILGDYGVVGGIALLVLYAMPLVFFLHAARRELRIAEAFGLLIASSLFLEAIAHAAMNLGALPFAGRNLPLLAANSPTDVIKWACLLIVAAQTPFWSINPLGADGTGVRDNPNIIEPRRHRTVVWGLAACALVLVLFAGVMAGRIARDTRFSEPFTWDQILEEVQRLADQGAFGVDRSMNVVLHDPQKLGEGSLLARELRAFNQLSREEKLGDPPNSQLLAKLYSISTVRDFHRVMREENASQAERPPGRPPLFRLIELPQFADEAGEIPVVGENYRVIPNPGFNTRISFRPQKTDAMPVLAWSARRWGSFVMRGNAFTIEVPNRPILPHENRLVTLGEAADGNFLDIVDDRRSDSPRGDIYLNVPVGRQLRRKFFLRYMVEQGALYLDNPPGGFALRVGRQGKDIKMRPGDRLKLVSGDTVRLSLPIGIDPQFTMEERNAVPLIGRAWAAGQDRLTSDSMSPFPWTAHLRTALDREWERVGAVKAMQQYRGLTIQHGLQEAAQATVTNVGQVLHQRHLDRFAAIRRTRSRRVSAAALRNSIDDLMPPRVALSAIALPNGEVLAMAGYPRMFSGDVGAPCGGVSWCPSSDWIDENAPSFVRVRYGGDRNFERIEMGSSTKPLFAAAAMQTHPGIENQLHVAGPDGTENEVFGIPVSGSKGWRARISPQWTNFTRYLAQSDNRYHVRLGFLALAERSKNGILTAGTSPSDVESMDGVRPWHAYPKFPSRMEFSRAKPEVMEHIDDAPFAQAMKKMVGAGVRQGDFLDRRYSFWSANGADDMPGPTPATPLPRVFDSISPESVDMKLDYVRAPRQYVSTLLGGNENRWANVDFAGAFSSTVLGSPIVPHIVPTNTVTPAPDRLRFPQIAAKMRPALEEVVRSGTAHAEIDRLRPQALRGFPDLKIYAKTGTLAVAEGSSTTSRLVIAYIRWENEPAGRVKKGVVLSLVGQHAQGGDATRWLAQFIEENADAIARQLR